MRILHTADWHLGKNLEGRSRLEEQQEFIDELVEIVKNECIDMVLVAGDVFDTYNPPAEAEKLFYDCLDRLTKDGKRGVIVIAGNHDSPDRLCASMPLAARHGIVLIGLPNSSISTTAGYSAGYSREGINIVKGGIGWVEIEIASCGQRAVVLTLPYPSEARLKEVITDSIDENKFQIAYSEKVGHMFSQLSQHFRTDTVNLAMSHIFVKGGKESDSERPIQMVGGACSVDPKALPQNAHYIALGHLHRPQAVEGSSVPAYYAGSPLGYSFSEAGQTKSVFIIDVEPGKPANIKEIHLCSGKPLVKWIAINGLKDVYKWIDEGRDKTAWIDLELHIESPLTQADIQNIREARHGIINIRPVLPQITENFSIERRSELPIDELFKRFYKSRVGVEPDDSIIELFMKLVFEGEETGGE